MKQLFRFYISVLSMCFLLTLAGDAHAATPYMQGTASWSTMPNAAGYHVYYKETGETKYTHSVVNLPSTSTACLISYLKPGVRYWYNVVAIDAGGKELQWSGQNKLRVAWMP